MKRRANTAVLITALMLVNVFAESANALTFNQYLKQVDAKDRGIQSVRKEEQGARATVDQASLITTPSLIASYGRLDDRRPTSNPTFQGDQTKNETYSFGLQQLTPVGVTWKLTQNYSRTRLMSDHELLPVSSFVPQPEFYDVYPKLELSVSLWRNFLGRETRGDRDNLKYSLDANVGQAEINRIRKENEIEEVFYEVATQQEMLKINKEALARSQRILGWSQNRVDKNLAEKSDLFQAQAAQGGRKLDIESTSQRLADASRRFNRMRGIFSDDVDENLVVNEPNLNLLKLSKSPVRVRRDLKAIEALAEGKEASYTAQKEKAKPTLDFIMNYATVGRIGNTWDRAEAQDRVFTGKEQLYMGVNFSMPLNVMLSSDLRSGYSDLIESQRLKAEDQQEIIKSEWAQFVDTAQFAVNQYQLLKELEVIQKNKADSERTRLNQGRSTAFQVLMFETDYLTTRGQRLATEFKIRQLIMNLRLFE